MLSKSHMTTAVLVFAYSPSEEVLHKPIPKADAFYYELTGHTIQTVEKSGLPYFHFTEHEQRGATFGERFSNAIQAIFDFGFDNVITIGNDSPHLKASQIKSASLNLEKKEFVLGPTKDGGFYLMGIHKSQFDPARFKAIPWQTNRTAAALLAQIQENNTKVVKLEPLMDLDCVSDLRELLKNNSEIPNTIMEQVHFILGVHKENIKYILSNLSKTFGKSYHNKGSPQGAVI